MRTRPPDLTEREVASSNTTLNTFFGGRQKAWMTETPDTVRPNSRPPSSQRVQSSAHVLPSPAPSDEPSPVQHQKSPVNETCAATAQPMQMSPYTDFLLQNEPLGQVSPPSETLGEVRNHGQADSQSKNQSESLHLQPHSLRQVQPGFGPQVLSQYQSQSRPRQQLPPVSQPLSQSQQFQNQPAQPGQSYFLVSNSSSTIGQQQAFVPPARSRGRSPKKQRLDSESSQSDRGPTASIPSNVPSLKPRIVVIDQYIQVTGGAHSLNAALERPRFVLLRDACNNEDWFYVCLHQMFCIWSLDRNKLDQMSGLSELGFDPRSVSSAFRELGQLIRDNSLIAPQHLLWFSEFPSPLEVLLSRSTRYRNSAKIVCTFLKDFSETWNNLKPQCAVRHYPPLVDEMVDGLNLVCPVLWQVIFTATRRNLGYGDDETGAQIENLFIRDRDEHRAITARYGTNYPPSIKEITERNDNLIKQYLHFYKARNRTASLQSNEVQNTTNGNKSSTPVLGSAGPSQPKSRHNSIIQNRNVVPSSPIQHQDIAGSLQPLNYQSMFTQQNASRAAMPTPVAAFPPSYHTAHPPSQTTSSHQQSPLLQQVQQNEPPTLRNNYSSFQQDISLPIAESGSGMQAQQQLQNQPAMNNMEASMAAQQYYQQNLARQHYARPQADNHPASRPTISTAYLVQQNQQLAQHSSAQQQAQSVLWANSTVSSPGARVINLPPGSSTRPMSTHQPQISALPAVRAVPPYRSSKTLDQTLLIPPHGFVLAPHAPNPDITALHQAHLRSPILTTRELPSVQRYYQAVRTCAVGPVTLPVDRMLSVFEFKVSEATFSYISKDSMMGSEAPVRREVSQGSLQFRLRCVNLGAEAAEMKMSDWVVAENFWPPTIFMEVNNCAVEIRRKILHGKDLPLDITPFVISLGANTVNRIRISLPRPGRTHKENYGIAVEIVEVFQHQQILDMCLNDQRIPAIQTLNTIKTSLSRLADDDEISMMISDLTIGLADPYMARIFDIPVRGSSCFHRECFDLETFLNTRNSKPKRPQQPSMVDTWKCPLCGKDARPYSLVIDEFLVSVRKSLAEQGLLDTKAINISADGSWVPKIEPVSQKRTTCEAGSANDSDDSEVEREAKIPRVTSISNDTLSKREESSSRAAPTSRAASINRRDVEVIELDDD